MTNEDEQNRWRQRQRQEDSDRQKFFEEVNRFPNLFNLKPLFQHRRRAQQLLEKQRDELTSGWFQYGMETDRCHNLIAFLLYLVDQKNEALDYCTTFGAALEGDIIRLTNLAILQWEMGQKWNAEETLSKLKALREGSHFPYLRAVALSEQGHAFTHFGPKYFLRASDLLREAIRACPQEDNFLWKYDLAIAIRRHCNIFVFREHSSLSLTELAEETWHLLEECSTRCPNPFYRARSLVELATLVSTLRKLSRVCQMRDRDELRKFGEKKELEYVEEALKIPEGQNDFFVLRVSGRHFMYANEVQRAEENLCKSLEKKKDSITYQLLAKLSLKRYRYEEKMKRRQTHPQSPPSPSAADVVQLPTSPEREEHQVEGAAAASAGPTGDTQLKTVQETQENARMTTSVTVIRNLLKTFTQATDRYDASNQYIQMAETYFKKALEINRYNGGVLYDLGRMYQGMDRPDEALHHFQQMITLMDAKREDVRYLVNAYEQSGICLLAMSEQQGVTAEQKLSLVAKARDMFLSSMTECKRAVRDMPDVSAHRTEVWHSYPKLIQILENSGDGSRVTNLQRAAQVHEEVGKYIEAIRVHQGILNLSQVPLERKQALLGLMRNHCSSGDVAQARLILDICIDEGHLAQRHTDGDDLTRQLRGAAMEVYKLSASQAMQKGLAGNVSRYFQAALMLQSLIPDGSESGEHSSAESESMDQDEHVLGTYDVCIFDDADDVAKSSSQEEGRRVSKAAAVLAKLMESAFGMSVSLNDEGTAPGSLSFDGELHLAEHATTVVLVLGSGNRLSHRMAFLVDTALRTHHPGRVLPVIVQDSRSTCPAAPRPLNRHKVFNCPMDLLELATVTGQDANSFMEKLPRHHDTVLELFLFILGNMSAAYEETP